MEKQSFMGQAQKDCNIIIFTELMGNSLFME